MRVLVVEDEKKIARLLRRGLQEQGFVVETCEDGDEALLRSSTESFDAIILDIMLPGRDGLSIVRQLRTRKVMTPVLLLTARGEVSERIEGLNLGADDYMAKPFALDEVVARLRALIRRVSGQRLTVYCLGDLTQNLVTRDVTRGQRKLSLTPREFNLLECLLRSPGDVLTRTQLYERVWEYHFDPGTNLVDVFIQRLRRKIDDGESVKLIHTVRGIGYSAKLAA